MSITLTGYGMSDIDPEVDCGAVAILLRMDGVLCCRTKLMGLFRCGKPATKLSFTRVYGCYDPLCGEHSMEEFYKE